jgi:hypothetical protein
MKNIKTYEQFINEAFKSNDIDVKTQMFCEGRISEIEYYEYLNEGIIDDIKNWVKDVAVYTFDWFKKLGDVLLTLLKNVIKFGITIGEKMIGAIKWILNWINDWADKHPKAWRIIIITVIIFILFIVCASSAHAQTTGGKPPVTLINTAIGFLRDHIHGHLNDDSIRMKAIAYLVDLKNGTAHDPSVYGKDAIELAKQSMEHMPKMTRSDSGISSEQIQDLVNKGAEVTKYYIETASGGGKVILGN